MDSDLTSPANCLAHGACKEFRHMVSVTSEHAISFLSDFYRQPFPHEAPNLTGSGCEEYCRQWKSILSRPLIDRLAGVPSDIPDWQVALSFSASLNSVPKAWPEVPKCMFKRLQGDLMDRITKEKPELPPGYLEFVAQKIRVLFPRGVSKRGVLKRAESVTPPFTSTSFGDTSIRRCDGGSYTFWQGRRGEFLDWQEHVEVVHAPTFAVAPGAGKPRPLVKNDPSYLILKPLHSYLYDKISQEKWLLRGEFRKKNLVAAGFTTGGPFFSADFTAATDSLPIEVAETILDTLAQSSSSSLSPLFSEARRSLRPVIQFEGSAVVPTTGQMMGSLLSFPLLCLQNWIAACWVDELVGRETPKLVNGDDLCVQASGLWVRTYRRVAPTLGLNLNEKKTSYSTRFMTMNSCYRGPNFRRIPYVRCRGLGVKDPRSLAGAYEGIVAPFREECDNRTRRLSRLVLHYLRRLVYASGRTLANLGFRLGSKESVPGFMWRREKRRPYAGPSLPQHPSGMHPDMVLFHDKWGVLEGKEVAREMVVAHWEMGPFDQAASAKEAARLSISNVWKELSASRMTRSNHQNAPLCRVRLARRREVGKRVWVPSALAERLENEWMGRKAEGVADYEIIRDLERTFDPCLDTECFFRLPDLIV
nr:MAG: RNA dependent RNA polymerase [Ustilaginoidea virens botourmiavirus 3]